jgi:hypothetical protein
MPNDTGRPPFEIRPGEGIGPFRLGLTEQEIATICARQGLQNGGVFRSGLSIEFEHGRAVRIDVGWDVGVSIGGVPLTDPSDDNVRRLLAGVAAVGEDWTELDGLAVSHWEFGDRNVFSFLVYAPGHRFTAGAVAPSD